MGIFGVEKGGFSGFVGIKSWYLEIKREIKERMGTSVSAVWRT